MAYSISGTCTWASLHYKHRMLLVLLAEDMVLVGIFAIVCLVAGLARFFEVGFVGLGACGGSGLDDFFGENFSGNGGQGSDTTFEVVSAVCGQNYTPVGLHGIKVLNVLPVTFHMCFLEVDISIRNLAGIARVRVRRRRSPGARRRLYTRHIVMPENETGKEEVELITEERLCEPKMSESVLPASIITGGKDDSSRGKIINTALRVAIVFLVAGSLPFGSVTACLGGKGMVGPEPASQYDDRASAELLRSKYRLKWKVSETFLTEI